MHGQYLLFLLQVSPNTWPALQCLLLLCFPMIIWDGKWRVHPKILLTCLCASLWEQQGLCWLWGPAAARSWDSAFGGEKLQGKKYFFSFQSGLFLFQCPRHSNPNHSRHWWELCEYLQLKDLVVDSSGDWIPSPFHGLIRSGLQETDGALLCPPDSVLLTCITQPLASKCIPAVNSQRCW